MLLTAGSDREWYAMGDQRQRLEHTGLLEEFESIRRCLLSVDAGQHIVVPVQIVPYLI